jgi:demethylmenaquinone methyltransferase/2-methoxy-6-polyprenyl-1,4-benzoquinol methylase
MAKDTSPDDEPDVQRVLQTKEETKAYYNKIAKVYDLLAERSERKMRDLGLEMLGADEGERILEVGFGTGHCLAAIARAVGPSGKALGIDLSEAMLAITRKLLEDEGLAERVELELGDAAELPYDDGSLDGIFTSFTLELFDTPELPGVLAQWRRVLRPGGRLVVVSISKEGKQDMILRAYEWTHRHFPNLLDCRPIYAERALRAEGFEIDQVRHERMWVPVEIVRGRKP